MALVRNFKGLTLNGVSYDCSISDRSKKFLGLSDQGVGGRGDGQSEEMSAASNNMVHQSNNMPMPTSSSSLSPRSSVTSHHHTFFQQPQQHQQSLTDGIPHVGDNHPGSVQSYQQSHFDDHLSPAAVSDPRTLYSPGPSMYQVSPPSHYIPMQSNYPGYPPNLSVPGMIPMPPAIPLRGVAQQHSSYSNVFSNASRGTHPASQYHSVQSSFNYPSANFTNPPRRYRFPSTPNDGRR